jgi:drug/metabolite transporter (DMT)-like permease
MLVKVALEGLSPAQITLFRLAVGAAVLIGVCWGRRIALPHRGRIIGHIAVAAALGNVVPFLFGWTTVRPSLPVVASILILAVIGTGLAYVLYFRLIADLGATKAATVDDLVPAFAVLFAVAALGEPVTWHLLAGGLIIAAAIGYDQWRSRTRSRSAHLRQGQAQPRARQAVHLQTSCP